jgi:uncharacterized protein (TIGR02145 family)
MKNLLYLLLFFCVLSSCDLFKDAELPEEGPDEELVIPVVSVSLSASDLDLYIDESVQLIATVKPRDASYKLMWWSDSPEIAKVDGEGLITALSVGITEIYVQAGEQVASCEVTVSKPEFSEYIDEYGINHGKGVKIADVIWAPVNCGYHASDFKYGKLYQWGRKYGQGYDGDVSVPTIEPGGMSVMGGNKKSNSNVFYKGVSTDNNDWAYPSDDYLWNAGTDANPLKAEYDPCPVGWRVPTYDELARLYDVDFSWTTDSEGRDGCLFSDAGTSSELFLPASGCRSSSDGSANYQGDVGYYWSSRPNSPYSYNIYFGDTLVDTSGDSYRSEGFSIRCVQDDDEYIPPLLEISESSLSVTAKGAKVTVEVTSNVDWIARAVDADWVSVTPSSGTASDYPVSVKLTVASNPSQTSRSAIVEFSADGITKTLQIYQAREGDYLDEYGVNHGQGVKIGETVWAPVNCGYHKDNFKYGKLYQWGRKYGQGYYTSYDESELIEGPISIVNGQQKKYSNVFFTSTSEYDYDWLYPQDNQLWNSGTESDPIKTEYDPCPDGWRVPTYAELKEIMNNYSSWTSENNQNGRWFSGSESYSQFVPQVFFSAAGYRYGGDGDAYYRGDGGLYWSSKPDNIHASRLYITSSNVSMDYYYYCRANAYSVRCVQE